MTKKKKVILLCYEMLEFGGINRLVSGYQTGFKKLGYEVVTYLSSRNGRLQVNEGSYTLQTKWFRPPSRNLGWANKQQMDEYKRQVKESEFVLMIHGAPHPTKSSAKGDFEWQQLYEIPKKRKKPVAILFTDNPWNRSYRWIEEVIDRKTTLLYCNWNAKFDSMEKLTYEAQFIDYPIDMDEQAAKTHNKPRKVDVAWLTQWKKWKGIHEFVSQLSDNPSAFYTVLFNSGIEYYNMRLEPYWSKAIREERRPRTGPARNTPDYYDPIIHNSSSTTDYFGLVYPHQVSRIYANSKLCLDLSGAFSKKFEAQFTCAMAEPMVHHSLVAVPPYIYDDEKSRIQGVPITWSVDPNAIIDSLEEILAQPRRRQILTQNAYDWVRDNCSDDRVAQRTADLILA